MSGNYFGIKKLNQIRRKYPEMDIYSACIGNGDHLLYIQMRDGTQWIEDNNKIIQTFHWIENTSNPGIAVPVKEILSKL